MGQGLAHYRKLEVAKRFAEYQSVREVMSYIKNDLKKDITEQAIRQAFLKDGARWNKIMLQMRQQYLAAAMEEPIAHRRIRLKRYDELYQKAVEQGKVSAAKACLDSAREEFTAAKAPSIGNILFAQINNMSDSELKNEQQRLLEKLEKMGKKSRLEVINAQPREAGDAI